MICVLDADCILKGKALSQAVRHFENNDVVAVESQLFVANADGSLLERVQSYEYMKTFQIDRRILVKLSVQCLISGVFSVFRKITLLEMDGYCGGRYGLGPEITG